MEVEEFGIGDFGCGMKGSGAHTFCAWRAGSTGVDAKQVAEGLLKTVLADVGLDAGFIAEDGAIAGLEIDTVEFLEFEHIESFEALTAGIAEEGVESFNGLELG
jgi:hypothetical protein